jgi:hypothetical protein
MVGKNKKHIYYKEKIMPKQLLTVVVAKCVQCGNKREIKPYEIPKDQVPMCEKCFGVMVAVKAVSRRTEA